jgi:hypothetical protein
MGEAEHAYTRPLSAAASTMPAEFASYFDGTGLLAKSQAARLSTIDAAGWPHAALLSAGEVLALPPGRIRFAIFPQSGTAANLARDGRMTLTLSLASGMCEVRLHARRLAHSNQEVPLAFFEATVETSRMHVAPYASVTTGITFALHEPQAVLPRWQRQIEALRTAG